MRKNQKTKSTAAGACSESEMAGIKALVQIREIIGDPHGKLMQDELVQRVRNLREGENKLREGVIEYIKAEESRDAVTGVLKYLLDETQWWDWDDQDDPREAAK